MVTFQGHDLESLRAPLSRILHLKRQIVLEAITMKY